MDINYFRKIQNATGTQNRRDRELAKVNRQMTRHFEDTFDTEEVLVNGIPKKLMIVKDTDANTFKKKIKSVNTDKFNLGDYVEWDGQIWLITSLDPDNKTWCRGYMYLCTVLLRWQNDDGRIIERYAYSEDFTKYSAGEYGNNTLTVGDNQYGLTIGVDYETKKLHRDMRFAIDFDYIQEPDVYRLTNKKMALNNNEYFGRGATMIITMSYDFFNKDVDMLVETENGNHVWICDYKTPLIDPIREEDKSKCCTAKISGRTDLRVGYPRTYTVSFVDYLGEPILKTDFIWNVVSDFNVNQKINGNSIELYIDDETLIDSSFLLQATTLDKKVIEEIQIDVLGLFGR